MKKKCYNVIIGYTTAGAPIYTRKCFCGTTTCTQVDKKAAPKLDEFGIDQEAFYKKVFG